MHGYNQTAVTVGRPYMDFHVPEVGAQNVTNIAIYPWLLTPALFMVATVLLYNFVGVGLRDAADPYTMSGKG